MEDRRFIKPVGEIVTRDPMLAGNPVLPAWGKGVAWDSYWQRRLDQGDVEMTTEAEVRAGEDAADRAVQRAAAKPAKPDKSGSEGSDK